MPACGDCAIAHDRLMKWAPTVYIPVYSPVSDKFQTIKQK
ncbi:MAG: hypothetical protein JWL63_2473 [Rhodocyclales bacterium]|nr:hypothetical protein [Rhodocyclales bacterium]